MAISFIEANNITIGYTKILKNSPFWSFAIHDGATVDTTVSAYVALSREARFREEDPYTAQISALSINHFVIANSRFQLDLNRDKENAIYQRPEQAWGLDVFAKPLPAFLISSLHELYDLLYQEIDSLIQATIQKFGYFVIYDVHSYNAKREGMDEVVDVDSNPEINIGTQFNNPKWRELTDIWIDALSEVPEGGKDYYDVRENIRFKGGHLSRYINDRYGEYGCVFSIEFRKDFMDEWTGIPYPDKIVEYQQLLERSLYVLNDYFDYEKPGKRN